MTRPDPAKVRRVACVGTGTIGSGWAAFFLSRGLEVSATDVSPDAERRLRIAVEEIWPSLETLGLAEGASPDRLTYSSDLEAAIADAEFIQESVPDREALKIELFSRMDACMPSHTVIASSSSAFLPSSLASHCRYPQRCIVGHPFVPSYLIPLVEVVGGDSTEPQVLEWAVNFYNATGKKALRLDKEIESYIANRLQAAVFKEAAHLVEEGVCSYQDIDTAMTYGPGMRWAFAGPVLCYHMGGGKGGMRHMLDHFGWRYGPQSHAQKLIDATEDLAGEHSMDAIEQWRDRNLLAMLGTLRPLRA